MSCQTSGKLYSSLKTLRKRAVSSVQYFCFHWPHLGFLLSQDWNAGSGADGRHRENHDAEWRHLWHIHGYRDGHPMLIKAIVAHFHPRPISPNPCTIIKRLLVVLVWRQFSSSFLAYYWLKILTKILVRDFVRQAVSPFH